MSLHCVELPKGFPQAIWEFQYCTNLSGVRLGRTAPISFSLGESILSSNSTYGKNQHFYVHHFHKHHNPYATHGAGIFTYMTG